MKRVLGIGNALTDFLVNLKDDNVLAEFGLGRGSMTLVESEQQRLIQDRTASLPHTLSLGGSAGNTIRAMAKLGASVGLIGKVGLDSTGRFYERALENLGIETAGEDYLLSDLNENEPPMEEIKDIPHRIDPKNL